MPATGRQRQRICFGVLASSILAFSALQSLLVPVLAQIERDYDTDQSTVTWVLTAYLLSASILTPLIGRVGDSVGKRKMLVITLVALSVGSAMAALAPSLGWLVAARVVQGAGGGVMPLSFGIIRDEFEDVRVSGAISMLAAIGSLGYGVGIVASGPIVSSLGLSWLFWLPMVTTCLAAAAAYRWIPDSPARERRRLPLLPALLLSTWLVALLLALSQGNSWGWSSTRILGLVTIAALVAGLWITVELRAPVPMIDMHMMRLRGVWTSNVVTALLGFGMFAAFAFLPQLMQTPSSAGYGFGSSISESGRLLLPSALAMFAVGFFTAPLVSRFGSRLVTAVGCTIGAASYVAIAFVHDHPWQVSLFMTTVGVGVGLVFAVIAGVVVGSVPSSQTGVASGMNANIRTIGGSIGAAVMAGVVTAHSTTAGFPSESGYVIGFALLGAAMLAAAVAALLLPDSHVQPTDGPLRDADNAELGMLPMGHTR
ncbi:MFS transporter [Nocardioides endophyticus]|uniref:MFS transporter n=1 Tax=Nocardioides endophyticus TaxID=1353775 RepID=A0ABP8ZCS3_9ACTN